MIRYQFNRTKTIQATAVLLRRAGSARSENYLKIMKILYYADRESLEKTGRPITCDEVFAMRWGPVLSQTLDLIRDRTFGTEDWLRYIATEHNNIRLINDPGNGELCKFEIDLLHALWDKYKDVDPFDLARETHKLPEYMKNQPELESRNPITFEDILAATGREGDIATIESDANEATAIERLYGN
jgi:uncharacterized phage-associated protein